jgi:hypothetical protein
MKMTPEQKLKHMILIRDAELRDVPPPEGITAETVDRLFEDAEAEEAMYDARNEVRSGQVATELPCEWSRHYESQAVAAQALDGSWIGWTYWHGGGKHGEPEAIDWIEDAYDLSCVEEEKMTIIRTFSKVEA